MQDDIELDYEEDEFNDSLTLAAPAEDQQAEPSSARASPSPADSAPKPVTEPEPEPEPEPSSAPVDAVPSLFAIQAAKAAHDKTRDKHGKPLPPGWVSKMSSSLGDVYYRNIVTNTSSWEIPTWPADDKALDKDSTNRHGNGEPHLTSRIANPPRRRVTRRDTMSGGRWPGLVCRWWPFSRVADRIRPRRSQPISASAAIEVVYLSGPFLLFGVACVIRL